MLFILTSADDATATFLADRLAKDEIPFVRLDTDSIISTARITYDLSEPLLEVRGRAFRPADITNVWYRRPKKLEHPSFGASPEGQFTREEWTEALEGYFAHVPKTRWMNHPAANAAASHKLQQLTLASTIGLRVPDTMVTQDPACLRKFFKRHDGQVIVKPMASGYVERQNSQDSLIYTNRLVAANLDDLSDLANCPTLFQAYVRKQYDVRVTIVDFRTHAVSLSAREDDGSTRCDIRRNNMADVKYEKIDLPSDVTQKLLKMVSQYGLRFAAIDLAVSSEGEWFFFEINPNGQWAWLEQCAAVPISDSFVQSFTNATV